MSNLFAFALLLLFFAAPLSPLWTGARAGSSCEMKCCRLSKHGCHHQAHGDGARWTADKQCGSQCGSIAGPLQNQASFAGVARAPFFLLGSAWYRTPRPRAAAFAQALYASLFQRPPPASA